jgi:hypothetical protein
MGRGGEGFPAAAKAVRDISLDVLEKGDLKIEAPLGRDLEAYDIGAVAKRLYLESRVMRGVEEPKEDVSGGFLDPLLL